MSERVFSVGAARAAIAFALVIAGLWGCSRAPTELVVYSSRNEQLIKPMFDRYTQDTDQAIKFVTDDAGPLIERLVAEGAKSPADLLITVDAGDLWHAAERNLLRPVDSPILRQNIPAHLRDPGNRWFGLSVRARTIVYSTERVKPEELSTYEALADPKWKNRICLRTSTYVYNQSFLATMIKRSGEPKVEQVVKGWVANNPTLINGDTKILEAIAAGQCDVGLTNSYYLGRILAKDPAFPVAAFWANQQTTGTHVNISGAGITANAKNRANAVKLLEFLTSPEAQQSFADSNFEYPANPQAGVNPLIAKWGKFKQDDTNIAAAGEFQAAATKLADRAGYK
ncbi:MAG: extracellular solute-binding protein [Lysobacterales bacterium]|nr:MAG: extracellular solute-binding protein [Xanthomonadales bacterium]